jgi:hypothetical protein
MRVVSIGLAGMAASLALFGLSSLDDGFLGAAAYMLALLVAPVAIGVAIALAINERLGHPAGKLRRDGRLPRPTGSNRCGGCGSDMSALNSAWVCHACDLVPVRR